MINTGLVYVGRIIALEAIEGADFIVSATVVCGEGGKWRGIVRKEDFVVGSLCTIFLPDSQLNEIDHAYVPFMKDSNWRVKMRRFKGCPSEVLITNQYPMGSVGEDVTDLMKVIKYCKPIPANLAGKAKGNFPGFIPKTDEPNYQRYGDMVDKLVGKPFYITEKCDGSSTTAYRYKGEFGVCSRNLELIKDENNGYWEIAIRYKLEDNLPEGYAIQWETCGPKIQSNPMGLTRIEGFAFSAYKIDEHRYLSFQELAALCGLLGFPMCKIEYRAACFTKDGLETLGEGLYSNGKQREGVVVRSQSNFENGAPISFKVINLNYEK